MYVRTKAPQAVAVVLAVSASLALGGCTANGSGSAPTASTKAAALTRDGVDEDVRTAIRKAGLDPAKGKTTAVPNGVENPSTVDWIAVLDTQRAEQAVPKIGKELERLGWQPDPTGGAPLGYEKADWVLMGRSVTETDMTTLQQGESLLSIVVTDLGGD
ncbi:hypothetical protein [Streptomyces sp. NBC_01565]|uniref:hypothetical protein n=1 Tax=unclassified Streptomyces TaxID=2593676 RepID=UPI0022581027|nr:hypothetical protein [Streptomyces sp. NBC_01565]MCX4545831.1 hypothetical protein [Streptomyces sp. NBC_01565]